jgi:hypothetical protein
MSKANEQGNNMLQKAQTVWETITPHQSAHPIGDGIAYIFVVGIILFLVTGITGFPQWTITSSLLILTSFVIYLAITALAWHFGSRSKRNIDKRIKKLAMLLFLGLKGLFMLALAVGFLSMGLFLIGYPPVVTLIVLGISGVWSIVSIRHAYRLVFPVSDQSNELSQHSRIKFPANIQTILIGVAMLVGVIIGGKSAIGYIIIGGFVFLGALLMLSVSLIWLSDLCFFLWFSIMGLRTSNNADLSHITD